MKTLIVVEAVRTPELIPGANAIRLSGSMVEAIGGADSLRGHGVAEVAIPNGIAFPLLTDSHFHPSGYLQAVEGLSVGSARDLSHLAEIVELHRQVVPDGPILGSRLDDRKLDGGLPDRRALDGIEALRPMVLTRQCGHVAVANTAALQRAGIGAGTADPPGGSLDRDGKGQPTGVVRESAIALLTRALSADVEAPDPLCLLEVMSGLPMLGIGSVDAMVSAGESMWCGMGNELDALLAIEPDLPVTINVFVMTDSVIELERSAKRLRAGGRRVRFAGWKGFADGSLGAHTAAMWSPFTDRPGSNGILRLDPTRDRPLIDCALSLGGAVAIHAIGDRANTAVLSLYERLVAEGVEPTNLRIEHASVLSSGMIEQISRLGVVASVQPSFMRSEGDWVPGRIGPERARHTYPLRSLAEAGVALLGGSDCPVEDPNPWPAIAAAQKHPFFDGESLDVDRAVGMYLRSRIERERPASFAVLDNDPFTASPDVLAETSVLAAWIDGNRSAARPPTWHG